MRLFAPTLATIALCLAPTALHCDGAEESAPSPQPPAEDAGNVEDAASPPECLSTADCAAQDEELVCVEERCLRCGPARARVAYVYDGDTVILEGGEHIRFLLVNTPEVANAYTGAPADCYGDEALALTRALLLGQTIDLAYDVTCRDRYDRLLAWLSLDGLDVNAHLLEEGAARVMFVRPNGASRYEQYRALEASARARGVGQWSACE